MSHSSQAARMEFEKRYPPQNQVWLTIPEYDAYLMLKGEHSYNTPEMEAVLAKIDSVPNPTIKVKRDRRIMRQTRDMVTSIQLPPRAPESRYPRATDVSSHGHIVAKSDTGMLYTSDYFKPEQSPYEASYMPLQRREDKTPLSPINGQSNATYNAFRFNTQNQDAGTFYAKQLAFQMMVPDAYRQEYLRASEDY